jgi:hypothetical protein
MWILGFVTVSPSLTLRRRLGSIKQFIDNPAVVTPWMLYSAWTALLAVTITSPGLSLG